MQIDDPIDNPTEAIMSDTATPRYGYEPTAAFAATRAGAERRGQEARGQSRWSGGADEGE